MTTDPTAAALPDQPDGIDDDSSDLPNPAAAAERVRAYICATGDGLYDIQDGAPLYARDLEALTRTTLAQDATRAERDQLRYERRLLGTCRVFLDGLAKNALSANLRRTAGDLAQRIVDEIGHPVTDEPALGPELRTELARVTAERDQYRIDLGQADTVLTDITGLHKPHTNSVGHDWCKACNALWPCRTWKAMEVTAPVPGSSRRAQEQRACRVCGCTDDAACSGGCWWVPDPSGAGDLCSTCALASRRAQEPEGFTARYDAACDAVKAAGYAFGVEQANMLLIGLRAAGESQASEPAADLFAGVPGEIATLAAAWLPRLKALVDTFNADMARMVGAAPAAPKLAAGGIIRRDQAVAEENRRHG